MGSGGFSNSSDWLTMMVYGGGGCLVYGSVFGGLLGMNG